MERRNRLLKMCFSGAAADLRVKHFRIYLIGPFLSPFPLFGDADDIVGANAVYNSYRAPAFRVMQKKSRPDLGRHNSYLLSF
jgi:hypothetical protein